MFEVKATYLGETRKFILHSDLFPSYPDVTSQLERVFTISGPYCLSHLLFSPTKGTSVFVGHQAADEEEYNRHRSPFSGRVWPNGLLRFTVTELSEPRQLVEEHGTPNQAVSINSSTSRIRRRADDDSTVRDSSSALNRYSLFSDTTRQSCCSVEDGKQEMKELMSSFLRDFNDIATSTFGHEVPLSSTQTSSSISHGDVQPVVSSPAAPNTLEDYGLGIPGAFVETATQPSQSAIDNSIRCGNCTKLINEYYHKCNACAFTICGECAAFQDAENVHMAMFNRDGRHYFSLITSTVDTVSTPRPQQSNMQEDLTQTARSENNSSYIHSGVVCDACDQTIVGSRHKCLNCYNFDLCDECYPSSSLTHRQHDFMTIQDPSAVSIHRIPGFGHAPHRPRPSTRVSPRSASSDLLHQAICDLCDSRIRGFRYKCLICPDFDSCESCYRIVGVQHPLHTFVKVESCQDLSSRDTSAFVKHNAGCNECGKTIRGIRYKCMHPDCLDYDLCTKCEAMPFRVHPATHPLLKLYEPGTLIPVVYRKNGPRHFQPAATQVTTNGVAVSTDPQPEKADASVHVRVATPEARGDMVDAGVHAVLLPSTSEASVSAPALVLEHEESPGDLPLLPTPPPHSPVLAASVESISAPVSKEDPIPTPNTNEPKETVPIKPRSLLHDFASTFASRGLNDDGLRATFIGDLRVEDGQTFYPGTEFIKTWQMRNDGQVDWPESTMMMFIAGDRMSSFVGAPMEYTVGRVQPGEIRTISVLNLKAPEIPGKYVGFWRLTDGTKPFGQSVWCDITVSDCNAPSAHSLLSASEVIMPEPIHANLEGFSGAVTPDLISSGDISAPATPITLASHSTVSEYDSADSLLDEFDTLSDDEIWERSRTRSTNGDFVVLYDNESTDEEVLH